jgi:spore maturation protein CgeB
LYREWAEALPLAEKALREADVAIVTSYCPDAQAASELVLSQRDVLHVFYDLDTPITLDRLDRGESVEYLPPDGFSRFDLVLSFTGGRALDELRTRLGAKRALPLYGSVDAGAPYPVAPRPDYEADLSYLGTYAADRQEGVERLFVGAARALPEKRFVLGGSMYPPEFPWTDNIRFFHHVPPPEHPAFYCSSKLTLNVTRGAMASRGYCPSGRLFEAAACATPILSDTFDGLDTFFEPGKEILLARSTEEAAEALQLPAAELAKIGNAARERVLSEHTADVRARQMMEAFDGC